jgi:hypothetical protein
MSERLLGCGLSSLNPRLLSSLLGVSVPLLVSYNVGVRKDRPFLSNGAFVFGAPAAQEWCSDD